jgi:hypothetical protein
MPIDVPDELPARVTPVFMRMMGERVSEAGKEASHVRGNEVVAKTVTMLLSMLEISLLFLTILHKSSQSI